MRDHAAMSAVKHVFPHDDPSARFVVSVWATRNDLSYVLALIGKANDDDAPEFFYLVRLAMGHLYEGASALVHYRESFPGVEALLKKLPAEGQAALRKAQNAPSQVGGKALATSRIHTFHYSSPDPTYCPTSDAQLADVLRALGDEEATFVVDKAVQPPAIRLGTSDQAMLALAMGKHATDDKKLRAQVARTRDAAVAYVNFASILQEVYQRAYDLHL